jgi:hypothetical protein
MFGLFELFGLFGLKALARWRRNRGRLIYSYHDGEKWRRADPFLLWRKLLHHPTVNLVEILPLAELGSEPETTQAVETVAEAFGVTRWEERSQSGLLDWEILRLVNDFERWMAALKKNTSLGPISPPATGSASSNSQGPQNHATSSPSGSGSIPGGPTPGRPTEP